jgi:hypothetical protein
MEVKLIMLLWGANILASILFAFPLRSQLEWKPVVWGTLVVLVDLTTIWWRVAETFCSENNRQLDGTVFCLYFILKVYAGVLYCVCIRAGVSSARIDVISAR